MAEQQLLLVSRDDISRTATLNRGKRVYRLLARLTRKGFYFLATAPQPDNWSSSTKQDDSDAALLGPDSLHGRLEEAGGSVDGVYYVPRSLLTQRRNREEALTDMMERYGVSTSSCHLFSSSKKFVEVAQSLGIHAVYLSKDNQLVTELKALLKA